MKTTAYTVLLLALSASATAATVNYDTQVFMSGNFSFYPGDTGFGVSMDTVPLDNLPQFDALVEGGSLNSVSITLEGDLNFDATILGDMVIDDFQPNSADSTFEAGIGVSMPVGASIHLNVQDSFFGMVSCENFEQEGPCQDSTSDFVYLIGSEIFTGSDMAAFIGTGNLSAVAAELIGSLGFGDISFDNLTDANLDLSANFDGYLTITYDFTVVPLPAGLWLFGSALLGLGALRRRMSHR